MLQLSFIRENKEIVIERLAIKNFDAGYIFAFFCFMMVLQLVWVKTMVPETKGRTLEEIEKLIV